MNTKTRLAQSKAWVTLIYEPDWQSQARWIDWFSLFKSLVLDGFCNSIIVPGTNASFVVNGSGMGCFVIMGKDWYAFMIVLLNPAPFISWVYKSFKINLIFVILNTI